MVRRPGTLGDGVRGKKKKGAPKEAPKPLHGSEPGPSTADVVRARYCVDQPYGNSCIRAPRRYQLDTRELDAVEILVDAAREIPALRQIAEWAALNGCPVRFLEDLCDARNGVSWAEEERWKDRPETWKTYLNSKEEDGRDYICSECGLQNAHGDKCLLCTHPDRMLGYRDP
jgi:hypothetical protein